MHENQLEEEEIRELNHIWAGSNIAISHTMTFQSRKPEKKSFGIYQSDDEIDRVHFLNIFLSGPIGT
jgi:hypothetical protein